MSARFVWTHRTSVHLTVTNITRVWTFGLVTESFYWAQLLLRARVWYCGPEPVAAGTLEASGRIAGLLQLADRKGLLSFRLQPGDTAQAEGKQPFSAKTRPSGNPALYPNSWTQTFLLFISPHMTWHIILKRFWPVKHHLLLLIFVITLRQKNIHPSCKKYK